MGTATPGPVSRSPTVENEGLTVLGPELIEECKHGIRMGEESVTGDRAPPHEASLERSWCNAAICELADGIVVLRRSAQVRSGEAFEDDLPRRIGDQKGDLRRAVSGLGVAECLPGGESRSLLLPAAVGDPVDRLATCRSGSSIAASEEANLSGGSQSV